MPQAAPTLEQWKALYETAKQFRQLSCWQWMSDEHIFGVRNPDSGEIGYCCVIGNLGEELGLIVYTGSDGLASYHCILNNHNSADQFEVFIAQKCLSVTYDRKDALEKEDIVIIDDLGLSFGGARAYPAFRNMSPGYFPWFLAAADADFLRIALDQARDVCLRCKNDGDLLTPPQPGHYLVRERKSGGSDPLWTDQWLPPDPQPAGPEIPPTDEVRLARLKTQLNPARTTWEFSYAFENMPVRESGRPYFPLVLLIADAHSGLILNSVTTAPDAYQRHLADYFLTTVEKTGSYPQELLVEKDEAMAFLLQAAKHLGIKLTRVKRCKESAKARKEFRKQLSLHNGLQN